MNAEIVSVGTELLLGQITDTHAPTMARILAANGIGCQRRATIGDNLHRLVAALKESLSRADLVITIGGLGPTGDDLTRDAIALALDDELERVPEVAERLRRFFLSRNLQFAESNLRQADKPKCGTQIDNPFGTAPGLFCEKNGKLVIALPGPKGEFNPMAEGPVTEILRARSGGTVIHSRILRVVGIGESQVERDLGDLMDSADPTVAPYAHLGEVHLRITTRSTSVELADKILDPMEASIRAILGNHIFGTDRTTLEQAILADLAQRGQTLSVAESMTGGALGARLTDVPGASAAFIGGQIVYSAAAKIRLGVPDALIEEFTPVSAEVTQELAIRCRESYGTDYALAITGNAGPTADAGGKPVGLVHLACASAHGV
ncbi:MAG: CinA family nicotinamide mononucleotide deamidase-related protein, partial [Fimbriimonas sp.]